MSDDDPQMTVVKLVFMVLAGVILWSLIIMAYWWLT